MDAPSLFEMMEEEDSVLSFERDVVSRSDGPDGEGEMRGRRV